MSEDDAARIDALRSPDSRRDLEWTGERMLPWIEEAAIAYEHLHRYAFAARLSGGRRVLDIGSGEGYGTALLAATATEAVGIDVDAGAVAHAAATYSASNLRYTEGSAADLSRFGDGAFDLVVCFEVIEHVEEQARVVAEARRVLAHDGTFICSTPEREAYRERTGEQNPFHIRELDLEEFQALLRSSFPAVALWTQLPITGSLLEPLDAPETPGSVHYAARRNGQWDLRDRPDPLYLVAIASAAQPQVNGRSVLVDPELQLLAQQRERAERAERLLHEARVERAEAEERILGYRAGMERREAEVRELVGTADGLRTELVRISAESQRRADAVSALERRVARVEGSLSWRALEAVRAPLRQDDGTPNTAGRALGRLLHAADRRLRRDGGSGKR